MSGRASVRGRRELLARGLFWSGASFVARQLPQRDQLLVLNYHRIGSPDDDLFSPGVFSATADELDQQISCLQRVAPLVTLEETLAVVEGSLKNRPRCRTLITFDDGYLDNYRIAFPILRSHGVQGVFFLTTNMVGSNNVPWWDHIAYLVRTARQRRFTLHYPLRLEVNVDREGLTGSLNRVLGLYRRGENSDPQRFLRELGDAAQAEELPGERRFLSWDEAREMSRQGMAIGSHTHSHPVLSRLSPEQQSREFVHSRELLKAQVGIEADTLAYPFGYKDSFSDETQKLARQSGYRAAFSNHGGSNLAGRMQRYDLKRIDISDQSWTRFQVQVAMCRLTGSYWP